MHPREECAMLAAYAEQLFTAKRVHHIAQVQLEPLDPAIFEESRWDYALRSLRSGKAVPWHNPSVQQWKDCSASASVCLSAIARESLCCETPKIPQEWSEVQLAWLAKAGKSPTRPQNLRSIGLLPADAKAFLIVLRDEIAPYVEHCLHSCPQYAYRKGTSTADALLRAAGHCSNVRTLLSRHRRDHTAKLLGEASTPLVGGLMCGIDLQKAFDALPHAEIHAALTDAGVPSALAAVVVQAHVQTQCTVRHGGVAKVLGMSRGLRQGCPIAPILYAAWSCRLCKLVDRRLTSSWMTDHGTLFADDLFTCWELRTVQSFKTAVRDLRSLIEALQHLGMDVNCQKSLVVLRICGTAVANVSKSYLVWRRGVHHLRIRCRDCDMYIPCSTTMSYLGATLSYDNFESQTFHTRASQAKARFQELGRILRTNGAITQRHRVRLYKAIIWPTLWYSLSSIGVTVDVLRGVSSLLAVQLRKVLRIHEQGVSNKEVLQRAGLEPRQFFQHQVKSKGESILADWRRADSLKVQESTHCYRVHQRLFGLEDSAMMTSLVRVPKVDAIAIPCPVCGVSYDSQASLQMHIKHRHSDLNTRSRLPFRRDRHALHGLPICRFCQARLHDWRSLEKHITGGTCSRIKELVAQGHDEESMLRIVDQAELRNPPAAPANAATQAVVQDEIEVALQVATSDLDSNGPRLRVLANRCALCCLRTAPR